MSLTEYERLQILKWFEEKMGPDLGANMMKLVPPVGWGDIVTKADLAALGATIRGELAELRGELRGEFGELRGEFGELRGEFGELRGEFGELRGEFGELRGEFGGLRGEMAGLRGEMVKTFVPWLLGSQTAVLAVVGFLLR